MKKTPVFFLLSLVLPQAVATLTHAQSTVWNNSGTGDWTNAANWNNGVPAAGVTTSILNGGTSQLDGASGLSGRVILNGGSTLEILNGADLVSSAASDAIIGNTSSATVTVDNSIWNITNTGSLDVALFVGNTGTGGVLNVQNGAVVSANSGSKAIRLSNGGGITNTLNIGNGAGAGVLNISRVETNAGTGIINFNHNEAGYHFTKDGTSSGDAVLITGDISVNQIGSGRTTLTGANTYTGGTTINSGTLAVSSDANLGDASGGITIGSAVLRSNASFASSRTITLTNNARITTGGTSGLTLNGNIGESGGSHRLFKLGGGRLTLTGTNTYSGGTTISSGTLAVSSDANLGDSSGGITIGSAVLRSNASFATNRTITLTNNARITTGGTSVLTLNGSIGESGGSHRLFKLGGGTLVLNGTNTYTDGTTIDGGTLVIGTTGATGTGTITVVGSTIQYANGVNEMNPIDLQADVDLEVLGTDSAEQSGDIGETGGPFGITKIGTGTLELSGNNTYTGPTNADDGLLQITGTTNTGVGSLFTTNGDVLINDGGDLTTTSGFIADAPGTTSTVTVDGGDSIWTTTGQLFVGDDGNGTLNITDEAEVTVGGNGFVGRAAGSVGMVTVDNAQFDTTGQLFIGGDVSTGTVDLLNGSSMTNAQTRLATNAGSMGTLLVDDSTLNAGTLTVSQSGEALMTVQNGSMLTTSASADFIGQVGMGTLIVDDSMANFGGDLFVGNNGGSNGILTVRNGATANVTGQTFIGAGIGATGTVTIDNATWISADRIFVGNQGNGTLNILNGSTVTSGGLNPFIGASADATGTLFVDGTGTTYTVNNTGDFAMRGQNSSITVSGGAELSTQGRVFLLADNGTTNNVLITGTGSKWTTGNEVSLGHTGTDVVMTLADGGTLSIGGSEALFVNDGPTNGTLNIGNGGGAGILDAANVTGGFTGGGLAQLNFNHTDADYFFTRDGTAGGANVVIGGNIAVNHMGIGTTTFNGANTYTGGTNITGGTLVAANMNALGAGNVNVNTAGTLRAMGPVNVGGHFNLGAGGILVVDVNSPDQLNVAGDADIQDGSLVATGTLARGEEKLVIEADGTLSGELAAALLPVGAMVEQNDQQLFLIGGSDASAIIAAATTPNEKAVANMLLPLFITPGLSPDLDEVLNTFEVLAANGQTDQVRLGLNQISPAGLGTIKRMAFAYSNAQYRNLQRRGAELRAGFRGTSTQGLTFFDRNGRMRPGAYPALAGATMDAEAISILGIDAKTFEAQPDNRWGFFANGSGQFGDVDGGDNLPGYDFESAGMTMGIDYRVARNFVVGFATGYAGSEADVDGWGSEVDVDSARFGLYATWFDRDFEFTGEGWYVDAYAGGSYNSYTTDRAITFGGLNRTATGETEGLQVDASLIGGYDIQLGGGFVLSPYTGVQYTRVDIDGYTETGAQSLNLTVNDTDADSLRSNLGLVLGWSGEAGGIIWRPEVRAAWQHEFLDGVQTVNSRFASGAAAAFVTQLGNEAPRDTALIGASLNADITETTSAFLSYDAEVNADYLTHSINGGFSIRF